MLLSDIKNASVLFFIKPITSKIASKITSSFLKPNFKTHFMFLEEQLATAPNKGKWLCGNKMTGADILISFLLEASQGRVGLTKEKYLKLYIYVADGRAHV